MSFSKTNCRFVSICFILLQCTKYVTSTVIGLVWALVNWYIIMYMYVNTHVELAQWGIALCKNVCIRCCSFIWGISIIDSVEKTKQDKARTVVCDMCASTVVQWHTGTCSFCAKSNAHGYRIMHMNMYACHFSCPHFQYNIEHSWTSILWLGYIQSHNRLKHEQIEVYFVSTFNLVMYWTVKFCEQKVVSITLYQYK